MDPAACLEIMIYFLAVLTIPCAGIYLAAQCACFRLKVFEAVIKNDL